MLVKNRFCFYCLSLLFILLFSHCFMPILLIFPPTCFLWLWVVVLFWTHWECFPFCFYFDLCAVWEHTRFFFLKYISCFNCFPVAGCWRCLTNGIPLWSKNILCTTRTLQTTCELSEGLRYGLSWLMSGYLRIRVLAMLDSVFYKCRLLQLHCAVQIRKVYTNLEPFLRQYDTEIPSDNHEFLLFEGFCS